MTSRYDGKIPDGPREESPDLKRSFFYSVFLGSHPQNAILQVVYIGPEGAVRCYDSIWSQALPSSMKNN